MNHSIGYENSTIVTHRLVLWPHQTPSKIIKNRFPITINVLGRCAACRMGWRKEPFHVGLHLHLGYRSQRPPQGMERQRQDDLWRVS